MPSRTITIETDYFAVVVLEEFRLQLLVTQKIKTVIGLSLIYDKYSMVQIRYKGSRRKEIDQR